MKMAPICLPHHSKSNDMQHDHFDLTSDFGSNFELDLDFDLNFDLDLDKLGIIRSVLTRGTQWLQNRCSRRNTSEVIAVKPWC